MNNAVYEDHLQFVMESESYKQFPSWKPLQQKKKNIIRWIWIDIVLLSILSAGMVTEVWEKLEQKWFASVFTWLFLCATAMLLYVISAYHTIHLKFRQTKREVRKLIFRELLLELKKGKQM